MKTMLLLSLSLLGFFPGAITAFAQPGPEQKITVGFTFGTDFSIADDLAVISAGWENTVRADKAGAVYVFNFNGTQWVQAQRIINEQGSYDAIFGLQVATNGEYIVITEPNRQSAHIYSLDNDTWNLDTTFTVTDVSSEKYGISCDIDGNTVVIGSGAVFATYCTAVGSAYVYELNGAEWENTDILSPSNPVSHDCFGKCIDIDGGRIAVGASKTDCYPGTEGYVCIFEKNGDDWHETAKIFAPDGATGGGFGYTLGLEDDKLVVSSPSDQAVFCYEKEDVWIYKETILTPNPAGDDGFGRPVSLSHNRILIGASGDDTQFTNQGAAYLYEYEGSGWVHKYKIQPESPAENMRFGQQLELGRTTAMMNEPEVPSIFAYPLGDPPSSCSDTTILDTVVYHVTDAEFETRSPKVYLEKVDSLIALGGCDSIVQNYAKYVFEPNHCTDTNFVTVFDSISVTDTLIIDAVLTGVDPPENINTLKVYPNPARNFLYINTGDYARMNGYKLKIFNQLGVTVFETNVEDPLYQVNLSTWSGKGLYFIQVIDPGENIIDIRKIILQ